MDLSFEKIENAWVAEFEVNSDFNLHLEREKTGFLEIEQRGCPEGEFERVYKGGGIFAGKVYDRDFGALVYPKWIKGTSGVEVTKGIVTEA